jgi:hypothetical protein
MNRRLLRLWLIVLCVLGVSYPAFALKVYVFSCGETDDNQAILNVLSNAGHKAVLGPDLSDWNGTQANLSKFHVLVLQYSHNYTTDDMPLVGQSLIRAFVKAGGGLITGEWTLYESDSTNGTLQALVPLFPAFSLAKYVSNTNALFTRATPDPILDYNLGPAFAFHIEDISGTQSKFFPKPGATVYYQSSGVKAGLVGWTRGKGRVLNFSTVLTATELSHKKFRRLFLNAINWSAAGAVSGDAAPVEDAIPDTLC